MKIAEGFSLMNVAGSNVVVPVGEKSISFKAMITLNDSGSFIWKQLQTDITESELLNALLQEYEIDETIAKSDLNKFVGILKSVLVLE